MSNVSQDGMQQGKSWSGKGLLVLIVGPSGSGKGTIIAELKRRHRDWIFPISCTTRDPRPKEKDGQVYHFISKERFQQGIAAGEFLEHAEVHKNNYYGTLKKPIADGLRAGHVVVREVDIQGFETIRGAFAAAFPGDRMVSIFLVVNDLDELRMRILKRGKLPEEEIARRMESAQKEIAKSAECDFRVDSPHGQIPRILEDVEAIIAGKMGL